jgi:hypothetical protein
MIYIEIPFSSENKRIDKDYVKQELQTLTITEDEKHNVFEAIYNLRPRGVNFNDKDSEKVSWLQKALERLGVGYRRVVEVAY